MTSFSKAVQKEHDNEKTVTTNGMPTRVRAGNCCVDYFYKVGASRGKDLTKEFLLAYEEDRDTALRILQWSRDVRGGAGERNHYRQMFAVLRIRSDNDAMRKLIVKTPEIGRWDDLFALRGSTHWPDVMDMFHDAIIAGDGLAAKWAPRKGPIAAEMRKHFGWTPKFYRKRLVEATKVVETQMCANDWDNIDYEKVPSRASSLYRKAFQRHSNQTFSTYAEKVASGEAKVNATSIYPHEIMYDIINTRDVAQKQVAIGQWNNLPNYLDNNSVLAMVDVSGSMAIRIPGSSKHTALHVALALGLYVADKNTGPFKDTFLTFSTEPELMHLKGDIYTKIRSMNSSIWQMSTNIEAAFATILKVAQKNNVPASQMPKTLLILSDMQFDSCVTHSHQDIMQATKRLYKAAGYDLPRIVFWNLSEHGTTPCKFNQIGVALVSGFSPSLMKSVLANDLEQYTPYNVMMQTVWVDRYNLED